MDPLHRMPLDFLSRKTSPGRNFRFVDTARLYLRLSSTDLIVARVAPNRQAVKIGNA